MKTRLLSILITLTALVGGNVSAWADDVTWTGADPTSGGNYYLYNVGKGGFLKHDGTISNEGESWTISASTTPTIGYTSNNTNYYLRLWCSKTASSTKKATFSVSTTETTSTDLSLYVLNSDNKSYRLWAAVPYQAVLSGKANRAITYDDSKGLSAIGDADATAGTNAEWRFITFEDYNNVMNPHYYFSFGVKINNSFAGSAVVSPSSADVRSTTGSASATPTYTATANTSDGFTFAGWSTDYNEKNIVSKENPYTPTVTNSTSNSTLNYTLYAIFKKNTSWTGETPADGKNCYLYNVGSGHFLSFGNLYGTKASQDTEHARMLCTLGLQSDGTYTINTHFDGTAKRDSVGSDNYLFTDGEGGLYVDNNTTSKAAENYTFVKCDENGDTYYIMNSAGDKYVSSESNSTAFVWSTEASDAAKWKFITKTFRVATYNVDGLPTEIDLLVTTIDINANGPGTNGTKKISTYFANSGVDVIAVQEDFNHNGSLMIDLGGTTSRYYNKGTFQGSLSLSGDEKASTNGGSVNLINLDQSTLGFETDGLEFLTKNSTCSMSDEAITSWTTCYGWNTNGNDKMVQKGYRYYLVTLQDGTQIDFYVMHMDADTDKEDNNARETQLNQIVNAILESDNGRPIVIMGDTNCRYTRDRIKSGFVDVLNNDERFTATDVWPELCRNNEYPYFANPDGTNHDEANLMISNLGPVQGEAVDKIIYVNNIESDIRLTSVNFTVDYSSAPYGVLSSEHWPVIVDFQYHTYDPQTDDVTSDLVGEDKYIRNVKTKKFLKSGGMWGTYAVLGDYGTPVDIKTASEDGKYYLSTDFCNGGESHYICPVANSNGTYDPYMDNAKTAWTVSKISGTDYYSISYNTGSADIALCGDPDNAIYTFDTNYTPNRWAANLDALNSNDEYQQWEILTADDILLEMLRATKDNPYNCTHLLQGANFDRNDYDRNLSWNENTEKNWWTIDNTDYAYLDGSNGFGGLTGGLWENNQNYAVRTTSYSGVAKANTWTINHQFTTGLPRGYYRVTWQGFYWQDNFSEMNSDGSDWNDKSIKVKIAFNGEGKDIMDIRNTTQATGLAGESHETTANNIYFPLDQEGASYYFDKGIYQDEMDLFIGDGALSMTLNKWDQSRNNDTWTCIDNFQLFYLGSDPDEVADGESYYIYNVSSGTFLGSVTDGDNTEAGVALTSDDDETTADIKWELSKTSSSTENEYNLVNGDKYLQVGESNTIALAASETASAFIINQDNNNLLTISLSDATKHTTYGNTYLGWSGEGNDNKVMPLIPQTDLEPRGIQWLLFDDDEYASYQKYTAKSRVHTLRQEIWRMLRSIRRYGTEDEIKAAFPYYDDFLSVWNNPSSVTNALATVEKAMHENILAQLPNATAEKPVDLTYMLDDCDLSDLSKWGSDVSNLETLDSYQRRDDIMLGRTSFHLKSGATSATIAESVKNVPAGVYTVAVDITATNSNSTSTNAVKGITVYGTGDLGYSGYGKDAEGDKTASALCSTNENKSQDPATYKTDGTWYQTIESKPFVVTDKTDGEGRGTITALGVKIDGTDATDITFDNLKLRYIGPVRYYRNDQTSGYPQKTNGNELYLNGTWRSSEDEEIANLVSDDVTCVDLTKATTPTTLAITGSQPNLLVYAKTGALVKHEDSNENSYNIVMDGTCANLVITDKKDLAGNADFTASKVSYERSTATGFYNTVCLPFEIKGSEIESLFGSDAKVYTFYGIGTNPENGLPCVRFLAVGKEGTLAAGTPCVIESPNTDWNMQDLTDRSVTMTAGGNNDSEEDQSSLLIGSFAKKSLGEGFWKLNSAGTYFVRTTSSSTITPFRMYLSSKDAELPNSMTFSLQDDIWDEPTYVDAATIFGKEGETYDLSGRRMPENSHLKGVYIENGKKVVK